MRVTERGGGRRPVRQGDYASAILEQCYVSEPIGTKYLNFDC